MKTWVPTAELVGIATLPKTRQGLEYRAKAEGWTKRKRNRVRGGGYEYHIDSLPPEVKIALRAEVVAQKETLPEETGVVEAARSVELVRVWDNASKKKRERAAFLAAACRHIYDYINNGNSKDESVSRVSDECGVSSRHLYRNLLKLEGVPESLWPAALVDRRGGSRPHADMHPMAWEYFKADYLRLSAPTATSCYDNMLAAAAEHGWEPVPCLKTFTRRIDSEIGYAATQMARKGDAFAKHLYPHQERDKTAMHALEAVNADGHTFDVFVKDPATGKPVRPCLVAWQDIYAGKILSYRVDTTENKEAVRMGFADLVRKYGKPLHAYFDNGRGFANKWMTGGVQHRFRFKIKEDDPTGILVQMGVRVHWTTPYHGQAKPIERAFKDLCDRVAKHPMFEGAYTGNKPTAKPENYGSRAIPWKVFMKVLERQIDAHNQRAGRRTKVCGGTLSFDQAFEQSYNNPALPIERPGDHLEIYIKRMFMAAEGLKVRQKDATVLIRAGGVNTGNRYWSEALDRYRGKKVIVRFDPDNLKGGVEVFTLRDEFICRATYLQSQGFRDTNAAREHNTKRRQYLKKQAELLKVERSMDAIQAAQYLPDVIEINKELEAEQENVVQAEFRKNKPDIDTDFEDFDAEERLRQAIDASGWSASDL